MAFDKNVYEHPDVPDAGARKRQKLSAHDTFRAVLGEYKRGTLRSGGGEHVKSHAQAIAIAYSEMRKKRK